MKIKCNYHQMSRVRCVTAFHYLHSHHIHTICIHLHSSCAKLISFRWQGNLPLLHGSFRAWHFKVGFYAFLCHVPKNATFSQRQMTCFSDMASKIPRQVEAEKEEEKRQKVGKPYSRFPTEGHNGMLEGSFDNFDYTLTSNPNII